MQVIVENVPGGEGVVPRYICNPLSTVPSTRPPSAFTVVAAAAVWSSSSNAHVGITFNARGNRLLMNDVLAISSPSRSALPF